MNDNLFNALRNARGYIASDSEMEEIKNAVFKDSPIKFVFNGHEYVIDHGRNTITVDGQVYVPQITTAHSHLNIDYDKVRIEEKAVDPLIGKWVKRTNAGSLKESWGKLKDIALKDLHDLNPIFTFEDGEMWGKICCDVTDPRDENPDQVNTTEVPWKTEAQ